MSYEEVQAVLKALDENYQDTWEQTRFISYWCAKPHYKNLKILDVIKFSWDTDIIKEEISVEELLARKQSMLDFIKTNKTFKEFNPLQYS